jgi:hypothetical protein
MAAQDLVGGLAVGSVAARNALRRIGSVKISLLVRSPNPIPAGNPERTTIVVGDVIVTPPADNRLRQTYDSHVSIRNRPRA